MAEHIFCQSCSMPIDRPEMRGTEADGSSSDKYCRHCYTQGKMVNPDVTLAEMTASVRTKLKEMHMPESFIVGVLKTLPQLERWSATAIHRS
jgi:hypothetical protein